ncbi:PKD domain-containing protein [Chondrinema litorale]|uniref:PKD domain-containing protein n=1 Tax=Chondrinema litorale TaxID=2994555 RepID=UPI0025432293|nr:PKD domain-containing protein [Chondrinema litorale]UZS00101.1 PKD domain-containing protein [Chondrinema litorale]
MNPSLHIRVLTVFFLCLLNFIASAQQTPKWSDEGYFGYLEYLPSDYNDNENKKYPLLIFLHGQGEIGNGTSDIWKVARNGPPKHIQDGHDMTYTVNGETHKFLVISPQLAASSWQANFIDKVVEHAKKTYRVDENRIYLTGLSLGGSGVWNYAVTHPDKLAAIAAVCGPQNAQGLACNIADAKLPAWVFHGDADNTVGIYYSYNMVNAINSCNPAVPPIFTIYEGVGHAGAWQRAYKTNNELHTPNLYEWLLGKNRIRLIVEAGDDKTVNWPNNSVTLEGFVSYPSENIKSINWTKIEGPAATLSGVSSLQLSASNMSPGKYIFRLTIESTDNTQAFDDVSVEVVKSNLPPIANAGSDKTIELPVATTTLDGTGSYDEDGNITSYNWRQLDGPGGLTNKNILVNLTQNSLASGNWNNFSIRPLAGLSYKDLKDDEGISTGIDITFETNWGGTNELGSTTGDNSGVYSDNVMRGSYWISGGLHTIKVSGLDASSTYNFTFFGSRAGDGDRTTIYRIGEKEVTLNASNNSSETVSINYVSPSASGEIEIEISKTESALYGYLNALVIEGNPSNIVDPSSSQITLSGLEEGEYIYELEVVDNEGGKDTDEVKVTVLKGDEPVNNPPVADAGEDQIVVLPNNSISIDGSESRDPDGDGLTYKWEKTSGSDGITLLNTTSAILQVNDLSEGEYEFMLTVTDDKNASSNDLIKVFVKPNPDCNCNCDFTITTTNNKYQNNGDEMGVKPGDVVCIEAGDYPYLRFYNFEGSENAPIIFKNKGGLVKVLGAEGVYNGITINYSKYFRFTGTGDASIEYGVEVEKTFLGNGIAISTTSTNYEIDHLEIQNTNFAGVMAKADPHCDWPDFWARNYTMRDVFFHDLYIHDTGGEGMYIGYTLGSIDCNGDEVFPHDIEGIKVYDNIIENSGWDGIQVSRATKDCEIFGNVVKNYALQNAVYQDMGILIGGGTTGVVYNNLVESGNGPGIVIFGSGNNTVYNNIVINAGNGDGVADGIFCDDRSTISGRGFYFLNNTIINPSRSGIRIYSDESTSNIIYNNLTVNAGLSGIAINNNVDYDSANNYYEQDINNLYFEDIVNKNYSLTSNSPVIDKGKDVSKYNVVFDYKNEVRSYGIATDIGAYEYQGSINQAPIADAGSNASYTLPIEEILLDGSGSTDSDGEIVSYNWVVLSGPTGYGLSNSESAQSSLTVSSSGEYLIELTVTDDQGESSTDGVKITVLPEPANVLPIADAGSNASYTLPIEEILLDGSSSTDSDGEIVSYSWVVLSGPTGYGLSNSESAQSSLTVSSSGEYLIELTVTDDQGGSSTDEVKITVLPEPANVLPIADAGSNASYTLPIEEILLDGSSSTDSDGEIVSYSWVVLSGPTGYGLSNSESAQSSLTVSSSGEYLIELTVTDDQGGSSTDEVKITVLPEPANVLPIADAGSNASYTLPIEEILLDGSSSTDSDGEIVSYSWVVLSGPTGYGLSNSESAQSSLTVSSSGEYLIELTVTDDQGGSSTDEVKITVLPEPANVLPIADAGSNASYTLPIEEILLDGSSSTDSDGEIVSYSWVVLSGPTGYGLSNSESAQSSLTVSSSGEYLIELTVTDDQGGSSTDEVKITVLPEPANVLPIADAGSNASYTLPIEEILLDGSSSTDSDGEIVSYSWVVLSGPTGYGLSNSESAQSSLTVSSSGEYLIELTVTDDQGGSSTDEVKITVLPEPANVLPIADAGSNASYTLPIEEILLDGSSSTDSDGEIVSYSWVVLSGPTGYGLSNSESAQSSLTVSSSGEYLIELTVTDDQGGSSTDEVKITVLPEPANVLPIADAGSNASYTLPIEEILLDGSSSTDSDGEIVSYSWVVLSGPTGYGLSNSESAQSSLTVSSSGEYLIELTVTDDQGGSSTDEVKITVLPEPANVLPIADAGSNASYTLPIEEILLDGSSSTDSDGEIVSYSWVVLSGPTGYGLSNSESAQSSLTVSSSGEYLIELTVTDDQGGSSTDEVKITVLPEPANVLPIADAGSNASYTLPIEEILLDGSSSTDSDGEIVSYSWVVLSGPTGYGLSNSESAQSSLTVSSSGEYLIELTVTDDQGGSSTDEVKITVIAPEVSVPIKINASDGLYDNKIVISWQGDDKYYYKLFRGESIDTTQLLELTEWIDIQYFEDELIIEGKTYYYFVKSALNKKGDYKSELSYSDSGFSKSYLLEDSLLFDNDSLYFGSVIVNKDTSKVINLRNLSSSSITIDSIVYPSGFIGDWSMGYIDVNETKELIITFSPLEVKNYIDTIWFLNNNEIKILKVIGIGKEDVVNSIQSEIKNLTTVYPNPFNEKLNVYVKNSYLGNVSFNIFDLTGQTIYNEERNKSIFETIFSIKLPDHLTTGMYFIQIKFGKYYYLQKLSKEVILSN